MQTLDCRRQQCPHPVIETRKLILASSGEPLEVLVGDEIARENVTRLAQNQGYQVSTSAAEGGFALRLTRGDRQPADRAVPAVSGQTLVFISADTLGAGSDELGRVLLKNFIFTLAELDTPPDSIYFVNAGVKLVCAASEVREALEKLACAGTDIAACGLCLEFFHLIDQVAVGRVTNILDIVTALSEAGRIIRP
ncbi:sulfurtransferase-like selenium metabolism protein YedF [Geoalkalibacter halelectricus]|uniref:Sulfurtransferase-like selenium metabolism protein YedF n=1 Tax=Geoalkalibacter halelectricus TaxID=2847045 RepID=A0ABY5ZK38_9BACT|nr:sulfurtransferase-like selenium metabolism protein YedF [Geoalkalibacter halelectricus]MDO3377060.1 sulfurtransferase-like selenium metabolism protein YedF [Geoalkalibacter halelectricus]UWZ79486.1 sulfurtransferase-like selenium metabolism protein YedF [Geoalkalibacter halelectricus]